MDSLKNRITKEFEELNKNKTENENEFSSKMKKLIIIGR